MNFIRLLNVQEVLSVPMISVRVTDGELRLLDTLVNRYRYVNRGDVLRRGIRLAASEESDLFELLQLVTIERMTITPRRRNTTTRSADVLPRG